MEILLRHPFPPVFDANSRVLILGTFPSERSRRDGFYYGHPQNRFWKVMAGVFNDTQPESIDEKKHFLLKHGLALWDVIAACEITGSSDSSIKNPVPNDIAYIAHTAPLTQVLLNGKAAYNLYRKLIAHKFALPAAYAPSTSPANAVYTIDRLITAWRAILLDTDLPGLALFGI